MRVLLTEFWFETKDEAEAFKQGVEFVNDSSLEVKSVQRCKHTDSFCVVVAEEKETEE